MMPNKRIDELTTERARELRSNMTDAERLLWRALRNKQIDSHRFRRQHPIGQYIADFACIEAKLVIELDGGQHQTQAAYDEQRSAALRAQGWHVLRFWNMEVLENLDGVLFVIAERLATSSSPLARVPYSHGHAPCGQPSHCMGEGKIPLRSDANHSHLTNASHWSSMTFP